MANYLICRIENYKMHQAIGVDKELEHSEEHGYNNPDWDKSKTKDNVILEHDSDKDGKTLPQYIKDYREENNIQGRMTTTGKEKSQTNVLTQCVITASPEYINSLNRQEQIDFCKQGLKAFKEMYPTYHIVDARIHFDESNTHMHINSLPLYYNQDKDMWQFSTTKTQEGKFHYREFQDHMFKEMSKTYNLERGIQKEDREHLTKKEWFELNKKEKEILDKERSLEEKYNQYKDNIAPQKQFLGVYKYNKDTVDQLVDGYNSLVVKNQTLQKEIQDFKDNAIRAIDKANAEREQAIWDKEQAIQERDKAIQIGRAIKNDRERNKQLDRLEEYGIQPTNERSVEHEISFSGR